MVRPLRKYQSFDERPGRSRELADQESEDTTRSLRLFKLHEAEATIERFRRVVSIGRFSAYEPEDLITDSPISPLFVSRRSVDRALSIRAGSIEDSSSLFSTSMNSPPLIVWIFPALGCAFAYATYNICIKKGSDGMNPILGGVILQFVAALFGAVLLSTIVLKSDGGFGTLEHTADGVFWSVFAGLSVGLAEMISFFVMGIGVPAIQAIPIVIGGSVFFGSILGYFALHETMSTQGIIGTLLLILGITLVSTDPAASKNASIH